MFFLDTDRPIFVASDLHIGDGGTRDNFAVDNKERQFNLFLEHVCSQNGKLIILGDLFDFWQANVGCVIMRSLPLLDRLAEMEAEYVIGNHDSDLEGLIGTGMLGHPFFTRMQRPFTMTIGGQRLKFMHGHEVEPIGDRESPGWGRILAILGGIIEDKKGSPLLSAGGITEKVLLKIGRGFMLGWNFIVNRVEKSTPGGHPHEHHFEAELTPSQNPARAKGMLALYRKDKEKCGYDVVVAGHTHKAHKFEDWYCNSGCWVGIRNNFLRISENGEIELFDWKNGEAILSEKTND